MTSAIGVERSERHEGLRHRRRWRRRHRAIRGLYPVAQEVFLIFGGVLMFALVSFFVGIGWAVIASVLVVSAPGLVSVDTTPHRPRRNDTAPDYNKQFRLIGRWILLFVAIIIIIPALSESFQERLAFPNRPKPTDCDWTTAPIGDKHCHYESSVRHIDGQIAVNWYRVND